MLFNRPHRLRGFRREVAVELDEIETDKEVVRRVRLGREVRERVVKVLARTFQIGQVAAGARELAAALDSP